MQKPFYAGQIICIYWSFNVLKICDQISVYNSKTKKNWFLAKNFIFFPIVEDAICSKLLIDLFQVTLALNCVKFV
jgi:hypothetical protein